MFDGCDKMHKSMEEFFDFLDKELDIENGPSSGAFGIAAIVSEITSSSTFIIGLSSFASMVLGIFLIILKAISIVLNF